MVFTINEQSFDFENFELKFMLTVCSALVIRHYLNRTRRYVSVEGGVLQRV